MESLKHRHEVFMRRCFDLARKGASRASPNPIVGAILTHNNRIIGEGYHKGFGNDHAEAMAISSVQDFDKARLSKSILYVSLEPCFHHGKTPPCIDLILKHQIPKVVISCIDPNPKVNGKSILKLQEHRIEVVSNVLESEGIQLIQPFLSRIHRQKPFVTIKVAVDRNGNMGSIDQSIWLSNKLSKIYTHRLRSEVNAILVGTNTAMLDNPKLTNRHFYGSSPIRVCYDRDLKIPITHNLYSAASKTLLFTSELTQYKSLDNIEFFPVKENESLPSQILKVLFEKGLNHLLLEGGAGVFNSFIKENLWDECIIIRTDKLIKNSPIPFLGNIGTMVETFDLGNNVVEKWLNTSLDS